MLSAYSYDEMFTIFFTDAGPRAGSGSVPKIMDLNFMISFFAGGSLSDEALSWQEQADGRIEARQRHAQVRLVCSVVVPDSLNPDTNPDPAF